MQCTVHFKTVGYYETDLNSFLSHFKTLLLCIIHKCIYISITFSVKINKNSDYWILKHFTSVNLKSRDICRIWPELNNNGCIYLGATFDFWLLQLRKILNYLNKQLILYFSRCIFSMMVNDGLLQAYDGEMLVNDGERFVNQWWNE